MSKPLALIEIEEQPTVIERLIASQRSPARAVGAILRQPDVVHALVAARGSSENAARYAQFAFGSSFQVPTSLATPSLFTIAEQPPRLDGAIAIGISQSGRSPDVLAVLEKARAQRRPTVAITNDLHSPLAALADVVVDLCAGREEAVAATKSYSASIAAIALICAMKEDSRRMLSELERMPQLVDQQLVWSAQNPHEEFAQEHAPLIALGRAASRATAAEIALKLRELGGIYAEAYSPPEFLHGPIGALSEGTTVLVVAPEGATRRHVLEVMPKLRERSARVILIGPPTDEDAFERIALVAGVPEWLSPLTAVIPGQLAAVDHARRFKREIDAPPGLAKVTLTY
jgi:glucosamine--fructose-6-phosphate aminotransferase (isomerizing)